MKKKLFESNFLNSIIRRQKQLIKENELDKLADDLENELDEPSVEEISTDDEDLEMQLSDDNDEINRKGEIASDISKNEDEILKDKIRQRIESANEQIIGYAEKVEEFLSFLNDPNNLESMKFAMDSATENSPLAKMKKTCGTRIARIAADIAGLGQELRSIVGSTTVGDMLK